jgi:hypothetical protein
MVSQIVAVCETFMSHPTGQSIVPKIDFSHKLQALVTVLHNNYHETPPGQKFCGIVFVKRRLVCALVHVALSRLPSLDVIKSAALVGHAGDGKPDLEGKVGMKFREQCEVIAKFRYVSNSLLIFI